MSQASHEFKGSVDFNQYELRNPTFQRLLVPPISPVQGQIYYNTPIESPFYYNSTKWMPFGLSPVHIKYADETAMFADQTKQIEGYIYFNITTDIYYEYLGTTNGDITDYEPIGGRGLVQAGAGLSLDIDNKIQLGDNIGVEYTAPTTIPNDTGINDAYLKINGKLYSNYTDVLGNNLYGGSVILSNGSWIYGHGSFYNNRHFSSTSKIEYNSGAAYWEVKQENLIYTTSGLSNFVGSNKGVTNTGVYYYLNTQYNFNGGVTEEYALQLDINKTTRSSSFAKFKDTVNNKGLEYHGDYESNFTARSLVTKQYVDTQIGSVFVPSAGAGLSNDGSGNIQLGNVDVATIDISDETTFYNGFRVQYSSVVGSDAYDSVFFSQSGQIGLVTSYSDGVIYQQTSYSFDPNNLVIEKTIDLNQQAIDFVLGSNEIIVRDQINSKGLEYEGDYEANFTPRSLVTQQYVTSEIIANAYIHPIFTAFTINTSGAQIIDELTTTTEGHISNITLRNLTLADLGFTGDPNANNYIHPAYTPQNPTLTGALVLASIQTDAIGSVVSITTRSLSTSDINAINISQLGVANGIATLDSGGKLTASQIPDSLLGGVVYQGQWNASTNTPTLPSPTTVKGHYYIVQTAGTYLGIDYNIGDWIISDGITWDKVDNTDAVMSVFGRIGNVVALATDYNSFYVRHDTNAQGLNSTQQGNARTNINAQITITGGASTITTSDLTINRALISNGSGKVAVSAVTSTELGYLTGVTSSIQTQLNNKLEANQTITLSGDVTGTGQTSIATTIANNAVTTTKILDKNVTYAKLQDVSANRILGQTSTTGIVKELTAAEVRSIINVADGANNYVHPTYTAISQTLSGATVLATFTTDATGHVTAATTRLLTPADIAAEPAFSKGSLIQGTGVSLSGTLTSRLVGAGDITVSHSDTSTQASVVNTGGNIIQSVSVDDFGHVTSLGSMFGDDRWARRHVLIDSSSTWLYTSEAGTYPGIHVGQITTGSSNFPSTLGGFAIFGGGQTNSVSYFARVFGFFRQYDSTNVYVGTANDNGANNGWALIYTSYNLTLSTLGGTPTTRTITINGNTQDLSANRTWNVGTVTSVALSAPVGFVVSGSPVTSTGTLSLAFDTGYSLPTTAKQSDWDTAFSWGNHAGLYSLVSHNHTLDSLSNVTITANTNGEILRWNGTAWINNTLDEANIVDKSSSQTITGTKTFATVLLEGQIRGEILTDLNYIGTSGYSKILSSGFQPANRPGANYFQGIHFTPLNSGSILQGQFGVQSTGDENAFVLRTTNSTGTWFAWRTVWHSGNLNPGNYGLTTADITAVSLTTTTLTLTRAAGNLTAAVPTWNQNTTGSAATLTTARTLTIGNTGKTFNGSANVSWSLAEIGAAAVSHTHPASQITAGIFGSGAYTMDTLLIGGQITPSAARLQINGFQRTGGLIIHGHTTPTNISSSVDPAVQGELMNQLGNLTWQNSRLYADNYHPDADKWTTARTLTIGNTGKAVNGSANVSWSLAEIGAQPIGSYVTIAGTETITGLKTFSSITKASGIYEIENNVVSVLNPKGGLKKGSGATQTGAIQIKLPKFASATMLKFQIDVYDYATNESFTAFIGGYIYTAGAWYNTSVQIVSSKNDRDFNVRFGHDGTNNIVWIGETTDTWGYCHVSVSNFTGSQAGIDSGWANAWEISWVTTFATIGVSSVNNLPASDWNKLKNIPSTFAPSSHTHSWADITSGKPTTLAGYGITDAALASHNHDGTYVPISGASYIQSLGRSASWGSTNGTSTGAFNAIMGTSNNATWILSATSGGVFKAGIQALDTSGALRFYAGANYFIFDAGVLTTTTFSGALSGNATTATTLQTARTINGTSFNGSASITTSFWGTARTITIGSTGKSVNGSADVTWSLAEIGAQAAGNYVTLDTAQTITAEKTFSAKAIFTSALINTIYDAGTISSGFYPVQTDSLSSVRKITLGGNFSMSTQSGTAGAVVRFYLTQDATGNRTLSWVSGGASVIWANGGTAPTLSTAAGATDLVILTWISASVIFGEFRRGAAESISASSITSGTLAVARGGTGISSYTIGNYLRASGATTLEQRTPAQVLSDIGGVPTTRTLTINGTTLDLSANRSWTIAAGFDAVYDNGTSGAGTKNFDWSNGLTQKISLTGNSTWTFSNPSSGERYEVLISQDATGGRTITFPEIYWEGKTVPTPSSNANAKDKLVLTYDGSIYWGQYYKNFGVPSDLIIQTNLLFWFDPANTDSYPGSGTTWSDLTVNNWDATLVNGVSFTGADANGAMIFDGTNDYATQSNGVAASFVSQQSFTVGFWIKPDTSPPSQQTVWGILQSETTQSRMQLRIYSTGAVRLGYFAQDLDSSAGVITFGSWNYVVIQYDSSNDTSKIFVNGTQVASGNQGGLLAGTNRVVEFGRFNGAEYFKGRIGAVHAYTGAQSSTDINTNYDALRTRYGL